MPDPLKYFALAALALSSLAACGQKAPLFLPGNPNDVELSAPGTEPAPRDAGDEDEDDEEDELPPAIQR